MALSWALSSCGEPQGDPKAIPSESPDAAAMASSDVAAQTDLAPDATPAEPGDRYKLDLASYQDVAGSNATGLWAPHQTVVVFPLDLRQPTKSI